MKGLYECFFGFFLYRAKKNENPVHHLITVVGLIKFLVKRFVSPCTVTEPKKNWPKQIVYIETNLTEENIELLIIIRGDVITRNKWPLKTDGETLKADQFLQFHHRPA